MFEVSAKLLPGWKALRPAPVLPDLCQGKFIIGHMGINSRSGITIPVPDPSQCCSGIIKLHIEAQLPETIELIAAAESSTDDQDVEGCRHNITLARGGRTSSINHNRPRPTESSICLFPSPQRIYAALVVSIRLRQTPEFSSRCR